MYQLQLTANCLCQQGEFITLRQVLCPLAVGYLYQEADFITLHHVLHPLSDFSTNNGSVITENEFHDQF